MTHPTLIHLLVGAATAAPVVDSGPSLLIRAGGADNATGYPDDYPYPNDHAVDSLGNMYLVGNSGSSNAETIIWKFSSDGQIVWQKNINTGGNNEESYSVDVHSSGDVFVFGKASAPDPTPDIKACIYKLSSDGTLLWTKFFHHTSANAERIYFTGGKVHGDNLYTVGSSDLGSSTSVFMKLDLDGNIIWQKSYADPSDTLTPWTRDLAIDSTGALVAVFDPRTYDDQCGTIKLDANGELLWWHTVTIPYSDRDCSGVKIGSNDSIFRVAGDYEDHVNLFKYDSDGLLLWQREISLTGVGYNGHVWGVDGLYPAVAALPDGGAVVAMYCERNETAAHQFLRFDSDGNMVWQKVQDEGAGATYEGPISLTADASNLYFSSGYMTDGWSHHYFVGMYKLPLDPDGEVSFNNIACFHDELEANYRFIAISTDYAEDLAVVATSGIDEIARPIEETTLALTVTDVTGTMLHIVHDSDPPIVSTGSSWISTLGHQGTYSENEIIDLHGLASDSGKNVISSGWWYDPSNDLDLPFIVKYSPTGTVLWKKQYDLAHLVGGNYQSSHSKVAIDSSDNIYHILTDGGNGYLHVVKHDPNGDLLWKRWISDTTGWSPRFVTVIDDDLYITGDRYDGSAGNSQSIILKVGSDGSLLNNIEWGDLTNLTGPNLFKEDKCHGIIKQSDGGIVITALATFTRATVTQIFTARLNSAWTGWEWQRVLGHDTDGDVMTRGHDEPMDMMQDADGNLFIVGITSGGYAPPESHNYYTSRMCIAKYSADGTFQWIKQHHMPSAVWDTDNTFGNQRSVLADDHVYTLVNYWPISPIGDFTGNGHPAVAKFTLDGTCVGAQTIFTNGYQPIKPVSLSCDGVNLLISGFEEGDSYSGVVIKMPLAGLSNRARGRYFFLPLAIDFTDVTSIMTDSAGSYVDPTSPTRVWDDPAMSVFDASVNITSFIQPID